MEYEDIDRSSLSPSQRFSYDYSVPALARMEDEVPVSSSVFLSKAKDALGTPYVSGGTSLNGFDCSGFVQWAYKNVGIDLPRTAREQSSFGVPIETEDMVAGDIVTFRHPRRGYHTGIYVGDGKFIHSPRPRKSVRIASLSDPYFSSTFTGARRVAPFDEADKEIAERLIAEYNASKSKRSKTAVVSSSKAKEKAALRTSKKTAKQKKTAVRSVRKADSRQKSSAQMRSGNTASVQKKTSAARSSGKSQVSTQKTNNKAGKTATRKTQQETRG